MADEKKPIEILFSDDSLSELSEDFKTKATVIFENAVAGQVAEEKKVLEEEFEKKLNEERQKVEEELENKIDSYLTYVAEEWMKENELAVENGIQVEIAENFLKGMKDLFTEAYVEVPESKVDIVAEMTEELESKTAMIDEEIDRNIELRKELNDLKKTMIVAECTQGLADTQIDKVTSLVEMIDFDDEEQFTTRVKSIVETYFKGSSLNESDDKDDDDKGKKDEKDEKDDKETTDEMKSYVEELTRSMRL
jgi:hypothetical protein